MHFLFKELPFKPQLVADDFPLNAFCLWLPTSNTHFNLILLTVYVKLRSCFKFQMVMNCSLGDGMNMACVVAVILWIFLNHRRSSLLPIGRSQPLVVVLDIHLRVWPLDTETSLKYSCHVVFILLYSLWRNNCCKTFIIKRSPLLLFVRLLVLVSCYNHITPRDTYFNL